LMMRARGTSFWLLAWVASAALWMVLSDSVRPAELLAGAAVAALAATAFDVVRRQRVAEQTVRPQLLIRAWRVLLKVPADVIRLTRLAFVQLVRREPVVGRLVALEFGHTGDNPDERALRAVAVGLGSVAPNTIIVGVDPDSGRLLAHQLDPTLAESDLDPLRLR
jgi:hypothetical protein